MLTIVSIINFIGNIENVTIKYEYFTKNKNNS